MTLACLPRHRYCRRPPLEDPLYYLANFEHVLAWVAERHGDLLSDEEHTFLALFAGLPPGSRALLVRMVMRKGEHFRPSRLVYPEIDVEVGDTEAGLSAAVGKGALREALLARELVPRPLSAYRVPGMVKVVQAAGRVIRDSEDSGTLVLMDDRFARNEVRQHLPRWWGGPLFRTAEPTDPARSDAGAPKIRDCPESETDHR